MEKSFECDSYAFLRRRAKQLITEGNLTAAKRLLKPIDNKQVLLFLSQRKLRTENVKFG